MDNTSPNQDPPLCAKGCGFYGNPLNSNLCSKCAQLAGIMIAVQSNSQGTREKHIDTPTEPAGPIESAVEAPQPVKINRCGKCNKKVGLLGIKCRCEKIFCAAHLHADEHDCDFDYKQYSKDHLIINNPAVVKSKITRF